MVELTIDDREVQIGAGQTILEACREHGIPIPTLCYHEALEPYAACRLCVVELEANGRSRLVASCVHPCEDGAVVWTNSEMVQRSRRITVELLMATAAHVPAIRALAQELGVRAPRYVQEPDDCILCGLCVRACQEIVGVSAISLINRGIARRVSPPFEIASGVCIECATCVQVCPTGAITLADITGKTRQAHDWATPYDTEPCRVCGERYAVPGFEFRVSSDHSKPETRNLKPAGAEVGHGQ